MARSFTTYWKPDGWKGLALGSPIRYAGGSRFRERGVEHGSRIYVVNIAGSTLRLMGRFTVDSVVDEEAARRLVGSTWNSEQHLIAEPGTSAPLEIRAVPDEVTKQLRFINGGSPVELKFRPDGAIDGQTLRGVRELTSASAALLDAVIDDTHAPGPVVVHVQDHGASDSRRAEHMPIYDDDGRIIKARFGVVEQGGMLNITIAARGGTLGTPAETNAEYALGLRLLVERLASLSITIEDALVDSSVLHSRGLSAAERRVLGVGFPLVLRPATDAKEIAAMLQRGQRTIGSGPGATRGNSTRRLLIQATAHGLDVDQLTHMLALGRNAGLNPVPLGLVPPADAVGEPRDDGDFALDNLVDVRRRVFLALAQREGQPKFRQALRKAYGDRCAVTACDLIEALEAAHIVPYWGPKTNHVQNGVLLRSDLHTLFDRGLIGIDPKTWTVRVAPKLQHSQYAYLDGAKVTVPTDPASKPNAEALVRHLEAVGLSDAD